MQAWTFQYRAALVPAALSISSFIYLFIVSVKVSISLTLTTSSLNITLQTAPDKSLSPQYEDALLQVSSQLMCKVSKAQSTNK